MQVVIFEDQLREVENAAWKSLEISLPFFEGGGGS